MKEIKFKIIELPECQVLIQKDFDNDSDENYLLVIIFYLENVKIKNSYAYEKETIRDSVFNEIKTKDIQELVNKSLNMFKK